MMSAIQKIACIASLAALAACGTPQVDIDQNQAAESAAWFTGDYNCTRGDAAAVDLARLEGAAHDYADKCVRIDAFSDGVRLYATAMARDRDAHAAAAHMRVGVVWKDADLARRLKLGPSFVTITGRVRDCVSYRAHIETAKGLEAKVGHALAPADTCGGLTTVYVSDATIVPTAMD